jgi:hypothetical protein
LPSLWRNWRNNLWASRGDDIHAKLADIRAAAAVGAGDLQADVVGGKPVWLALNARAGLMTGVLMQYVDGQIAILGDWMVEDEPLSVVKEICREASMHAGLALPLLCPLGFDDGYAAIHRGRRLSLEELVAGALILYPSYLNPVTRLRCPPEIIIERLDDPNLWRPGPLAIGRRIQGHLVRCWNELTRPMRPPAGHR